MVRVWERWPGRRLPGEGEAWSQPRLAVARAFLAALVVAIACSPGAAQVATDPDAADKPDRPGSANDTWAATVELDPSLAQTETWTGGDRSGTSWAMYSGLTWAPFTTLRDDGLRVRVLLAAGRSPYDSLARSGDDIVPQRYVATTFAGQALAGGQIKRGAFTLKAFGGLAIGMKRDTPLDPSDPDQRRRVGGVVALEGWLDLGPGFVQLDTSLAQIDRTVNGRLRAGWQIFDEVWLGPEMSAARSQPAAMAVPLTRFSYGGFVRATWDRGEVSASAGLSHDSATGAARYLGAQVLTRY